MQIVLHDRAGEPYVVLGLQVNFEFEAPQIIVFEGQGYMNRGANSRDETVHYYEVETAIFGKLSLKKR